MIRARVTAGDSSRDSLKNSPSGTLRLEASSAPESATAPSTRLEPARSA